MPKKKKDTLTPPGRRQRAYELPNLVNVQGSPDLVRQIEDEALRDLSSEYRQLRVEEMISKKRRQLEKSDPTSASSMPMRQIEDDALRDLSSEYRQLRVEEMIQKKKRQLEKASPSSDISLQRQNLDLVTTIFKLAKELQPQQGKDDTIEYVKMFKDLLIESAKIQNQGSRGPSFFEAIITDPNLYQRTKDIFGKPNTATSEFDLKIEELRGERTMMMRKWELEAQKEEWKRRAEETRTENLIQFFGPLAAAAMGPASQKARELGQKHASAHNPSSFMPPTVIPQLNAVQLMCSCGYQGVEQLTDPPQTEIKCPECGIMLNVNPPLTPEKEEKKDEPYI